LLSKKDVINPGKDLNALSDEQKDKMVSTLQDLADHAPDAIKAPMAVMAKGYADVVAGKIQTTDDAAMQPIADATVAYTNWTITKCAENGGS
jgi:hypothetical protein